MVTTTNMKIIEIFFLIHKNEKMFNKYKIDQKSIACFN